jgi:hypothetical protein
MFPVKPDLRRNNVMLSPVTVSIWENRSQKVCCEAIREGIHLKVQFIGITWEVGGFSITIKSVEVSIQFTFIPLYWCYSLTRNSVKFSQKYQLHTFHTLTSVFGAWSLEPATQKASYCNCYSSCHVLQERENLCHIPEFSKEEGTQESSPLSKT